jgi:hypothetical protein
MIAAGFDCRQHIVCLNYSEILPPQYYAYGNTHIALSNAGREFNTNWYGGEHLTM